MGEAPRERRASDKIIGEVLASRYQIESRLGEGAMGAVYKAKHVKVGRPFAVKVLHPKLLEDEKTAQRFEREAELAGRLRHPNVIGVVDVGETHDGLRYMVMDYAEGPDLASVLNDAPLSSARTITLTRQLLEGLYHAHEAGMIHRDFKPENVIVERDAHGMEVPRIVDFGIAILREGGDSPSSEGRLTTNGLVLGTPHYMAPEQAVADPIDHRIDLFALGIVIYEMLCGKLPFDGTGAEVARANLLLDPPAISQRVPYLEVDPLLEAFSRRLMAKKRESRPATAKIARDLLDLIEKDRDAAAAALGVPAQNTRLPNVTAPSAPMQRHAYGGSDTFPPMNAPTDSNSVPMQSAQYQTGPVYPYQTGPNYQRAQSPAMYPSGAGPMRTDAVAPLAQRSRLVPILGGFGVALAAGVIALVVTRTKTPAALPPPAKPVEIAPLVVKTETPPVAKVETPPTTNTTPEVKTETPTNPVIAKHDPVTKKNPVTPVKKIEKVAETKQTTPVKNVPAAQMTAQQVANLYGKLGKQLVDLGEPGADVLAKWRLIKIQDAMSSPEKLAAAAKTLQQLQGEVANIHK
ncbi:MAG TPA: serine/threonine-protein kinase [Kofleriaceae bacterium]